MIINKTTKKLILVFTIILLVTFVVGLLVFNWYVSSDDFTAQLETMRFKLQKRGMKFGTVTVGRLGQIEIVDFSVDLGELGQISLKSLKGRVEFSSLLGGEVKTIFDVTEIVSQYIDLRMKKDLSLETGGSIQFSFGGDLKALKTGEGLNGDIYVEDCKLLVHKNKMEISVEDAVIPVTSPGPVISFPQIEIKANGRPSTLTGSIRNILRKPEFVDTTLSVQHSSIKIPIQDALKLFNDKEINRKVAMDGDADIKMNLNGAVLSPDINVTFDIPNYVLDFHGTHRNIKITFGSFSGELKLSSYVDGVRFQTTLKGKDFLYDYYEIKASHLPHLFFRGKEVICKASYKDSRLDFTQLVASTYEGRIAGKLNCDFSVNPVEYSFAAVGNNIEFEKLLSDILSRETFMGGNLDFMVSGSGKTLLLEWMVAEGKCNLKDVRLKALPDSEQLKLPLVKKVFPGLKFNDGHFDFKIDHGFLDFLKLNLKGKNCELKAFSRADILNLDVNGGYGFTVKEPLLRKYPGLLSELPEKHLNILFNGRLMRPLITYNPSQVSK